MHCSTDDFIACGDDVRVSSHAILRNPDLIRIGRRVAIDEFVVVTTKLTLGSYIHIAPHCSVIGGRQSEFIMEDFSTMSAGCRIVCGSDDFSGPFLTNPMVPIEYRNPTFSTVRLARCATLGVNVMLLPGVTVGEGACVGAGSLVKQNLEPWGIYAGVPARQLGTRDGTQVLACIQKFIQKSDKSLGA